MLVKNCWEVRTSLDQEKFFALLNEIFTVFEHIFVSDRVYFNNSVKFILVIENIQLSDQNVYTCTVIEESQGQEESSTIDVKVKCKFWIEWLEAKLVRKHIPLALCYI